MLLEWYVLAISIARQVSSQEITPAGNMTFKISAGVQGKAATWTNWTRTMKSPGDGNRI